MQVPTENINICFVGGVSTGKSTILNAIFCEEYTQCKIKRTTMIPTVYVENPADSSVVQSPDEILQIVSQKNKDLIDKTEKNMETTAKEYEELVFQVGKLDINIVENAYVNVYDIPGLNDARTKEIYYNYLEQKFNEFNIVVFIVDLHSGMNTNDEIDILNFITKNTKYYNDKTQKIYHLVIVNKADDMQVDETSGDLIIAGELKEMYEQVEKTVIDQYERLEIRDQLIGIMPLCALDAYLYRMVQKHGKSFKLSQEQILKIGINEHGKKFSTWKPAVQEQKVYECLEDKEFIETMIQLSGFACLEKYLKTFLEKQGAPIRLNNILHEMRKLPDFSKELKIDCNGNNSNIETVLDKFRVLYSTMKTIDVDMYQEKIMIFAEKIRQTVEKQIVKFSNIVNMIDAYDLFVEMVGNVKFDDLFNYLELSSYPKNLKSKAMNLILNDITATQYNLFKFAGSIERLKHIDAFTQENVEKIISCIINDIFHKDILININLSNDILISKLDEIKNLNVDISVFIRWILYNKYKLAATKDEAQIYVAKLYFQYNQDYQMLNLIDSIIVSDSKIGMQTYMRDVDVLFQKYDDKMELEKYYTSLVQKEIVEIKSLSNEVKTVSPVVDNNLLKIDDCKYELKYLKLKLDYELLLAKVEHLEETQNTIALTQQTIVSDCGLLNEKLIYTKNKIDDVNESSCIAYSRMDELHTQLVNIQHNIDNEPDNVFLVSHFNSNYLLGYSICDKIIIENNCKIIIESARNSQHLLLKIINVDQPEKNICLDPGSFNNMKSVSSGVHIRIVNIEEFISGYGIYAEQAFMHIFNIFTNFLSVDIEEKLLNILTNAFNHRDLEGAYKRKHRYYDLDNIILNFPKHKISRKSKNGLTREDLIDFINNSNKIY